MSNLPTGPYKLEASLQGFRTYVQTGIVLQVNGNPTINVVLAVGNVAETISVEGAAPLVDVRSAGISEVVDNQKIVELPLQGRQVTNLIILAGGAVNTGDVSGQRNRSDAVAISVYSGARCGRYAILRRRGPQLRRRRQPYGGERRERRRARGCRKRRLA